MPYPTYDRWKPIVIEVSAWVLAVSASMILGLLCFSGMLAIWPALTVAFAAFFFAIVIEGQIYLDNIRSAFEKFTDPKAYEHQLTAIYLQEKLADYDKNRDLFVLREPTPEDQKRVCDHNQVVVFRKDEHYEIGYRNQSGEYTQKALTREQSQFLEHYSKEQFMEIPGHHAKIQEILQQLDEPPTSRPQKDYPLFIRAYVSQCLYMRKLNCYLHTQPANEDSQNELTNMSNHLMKLDEEINDSLFHDVELASVDDKVDFIALQTKYSLNLDTMAVSKSQPKRPPKLLLPGMNANIFNKQLSTPPSEDLRILHDADPILTNLSQQTYQFHRNKLVEWIRADKEVWKARLSSHTLYSRLAFLISAFAGLIMGIGTTYLIMEAVAVIPWLAVIPLTMFPPVIAPLALIAGAAHGLLIYNSLTDILLDNPAKKFMDRMRAISWQEMNLKKGLILALSVLLLAVTIFLTICTAGTWLTVFHKTKPLFAFLNVIPNLVLNLIIPILIGISILPFSIQSVTNTLEGLENNPSLDAAIAALDPRTWRAPTWRLPRTSDEAYQWVSDTIWKQWVPHFLGVTAAEFAEESNTQKWNPYRIIYRLLFKPLRDLIFIGHLLSAGATSDQIEGVPVMFSFWLNVGFECAEDWDWIMGRAHVDNLDTLDLLKERAQKADDHNHDKNLPMMLLNLLFEPILQRAAKWDNDERCKAGKADNVEERYAKIKGLKPQEAAPTVPIYRKSADFNLFLFKTSVYESSVSLTDSCCTPLPSLMTA